MRKAVFAGSFDPLTDGHCWVIKEACHLFDQLEVLVADNPLKKYMFSTDERLSMVRQFIDQELPLGANIHANKAPMEYVVRYAWQQQADYLVRGIRNSVDFEYEKTLAELNSSIESGVTTVFISPPSELVNVSSTLVKSLIGPDGWLDIVSRHVPQHVADALAAKFSA